MSKDRSPVLSARPLRAGGKRRRFGRAVESTVLKVRDIATLPGLRLTVAAGQAGLDNEVSWLHVSELSDPTRFLEGGEFLLTTGLGVGVTASAQRAYVRRLAEHGLAGLGFGVGFGFTEVPSALASEADRLGFPVLSIPYEVPFVAITRAAFTHLASEQLERLTRALEVHERLAEAVIEGRGLHALLAILCGHLECSLALVDEEGRIVAERHGRKRLSFESALELMSASEVDAIYLVDSFGSFYSEQVRQLLDMYLRHAAKHGKTVGMHAHNNQQLAYANTIEAAIGGANMLDSSMAGLGRGAGNCQTELLVGFLHNPKYRLRPVLECIQHHIEPLRPTLGWGFDIPYMITGQLNQHPRAAIEFNTTEHRGNLVKFFDSLVEEE